MKCDAGPVFVVEAREDQPVDRREERSSVPGWVAPFGALVLLATAAAPQTHVVTWGSTVSDSRWSSASFADISCGGVCVLALRSDGSLAAWGDNSWGQCEVPVPPPGVTYVEAAGGHGTSYARRSDGTIVAWGLYRALGSCDVPPLPAGLIYVELAAGGRQYGFIEHSYALARRSDGSVVAWGVNDNGQCDVPALPPGLTYVEIEAGANHSVARRSDGSLVAFGANGYGQCDVPALPTGRSVVQIAAGRDHTLLLLDDGSLLAFGGNYRGQCDVPPLPVGLTYVEIAAGAEHSLARRSDGSAVAWGENSYGQCDVPTLPAGLVYAGIDAGDRFSAWRRSDGIVQLSGGEGDWMPPALPGGVSYVQVDMDLGVIALRSDGAAVVWGGYAPVLGPAPALPPGVTYVGVAGGDWHYLALRSDGAIEAWGDNTFGACDVPALPPGMTYVEVGAQPSGSLALRSDGRIIGWGESSNAPAPPAGLGYVAFTAGASHATARRSDGSFIAWGLNSSGQCNIPALPSGLRYLQVVPGSTHTVALRSDGSVVAFGSNTSGECDVPALPAGLVYEEVAAGQSSTGQGFCMAKRSDGSFVGWGGSSWGNVLGMPATLADLDCYGFDSGRWGTIGLYDVAPSTAPELASVTPNPIETLIPGTEKTIAIAGDRLDQATALLLDGLPVAPARFTVVSASLILLDMPQVSSLGVHQLSVTDGSGGDSFPVTLVAPSHPVYELGTGDTRNPVDRDDGLRFRLAGPVGSVHYPCASPSDLPSTNGLVSLAIGNGFTQLWLGPGYVIPAAGWMEVTIPASSLLDPGPAGMLFHSQTIALVLRPLHFEVSNLQSIQLLQ